MRKTNYKVIWLGTMYIFPEKSTGIVQSLVYPSCPSKGTRLLLCFLLSLLWLPGSKKKSVFVIIFFKPCLQHRNRKLETNPQPAWEDTQTPDQKWLHGTEPQAHRPTSSRPVQHVVRMASDPLLLQNSTKPQPSFGNEGGPYSLTARINLSRKYSEEGSTEKRSGHHHLVLS